jgi:hypothetical protein
MNLIDWDRKLHVSKLRELCQRENGDAYHKTNRSCCQCSGTSSSEEADDLRVRILLSRVRDEFSQHGEVPLGVQQKKLLVYVLMRRVIRILHGGDEFMLWVQI